MTEVTQMPPVPPRFDHGPIELAVDAPDFTLTGVDGRQHSLAEYDDAEALVIIQAATNCPFVRAWEGRIKAIHADYGRRGVAVILVNSNAPTTHPEDSLEGMIARAADEGFEFPYLRDDDQSLALALGSTTTPEVFVFDRQRKLAYHGMIDNHHDETKTTEHYLRDALDAILDGDAPPIAQTEPLGCMMKWPFRPASRVELNGDIEKAVNGASAIGRPVAISYIGDDGYPHLSYRSSLKVLGPRQLAFWARDSKGGLATSIPKHPEVALVYLNMGDHAGTSNYFSFRGRARLDPSVNDTVYSWQTYGEMTHDPERRGVAVVIDVESVQGLGLMQGVGRSGLVNMTG